MSGFTLSVAPDITESLPSVISARAAARTFANTTIQFSLSIADLPFIQSPTEANPETRQTADWRRQQFDNSREAGEQSLDQAEWIRSSASWHFGAGIKFYEPGSDATTEFRFSKSVGIDVWTQGQLSLLHRMDLHASSVGQAEVAGAVVGGTDVYFMNLNGTLKRSDGTTDTAYTGFTTAVGAPAVTGAKVVVGASTQAWIGNANGSTLTSLGLTGVTGNVTPYWAKSRLILVNGVSLSEMALSFGGGAMPTPFYTHPDSGWTWSDITETTDAILAAGYSNGLGAIYRFSLTDPGSGTTPIIGPGHQIAELPPGEIPYAIKAYLGKYIGIGTNLGIRVGPITGATSISPTVIAYGPLLNTSPLVVKALAARDRFLYASVFNGVDGKTGAVRVDLQNDIPNLPNRFPFTFDANTHNIGASESLCFLGSTDRVVMGVTAIGIYQQSADHYEASGYLETGNVRYATSEAKAFRNARVRANYTGDTGVSLTTITPAGSEAFITRQTGASNTNDDVALATTAQFEYLGFRLALDSGAAFTATPVVNSFQVKAIPAPKKQRLISYQILLTDNMRDHNGAPLGTDGYAAKALIALEDLESSSAIILVKDQDTGEAYQGTIDRLQFTRNAPRAKNGEDFGGFLTIIMRKLDQ